MFFLFQDIIHGDLVLSVKENKITSQSERIEFAISKLKLKKELILKQSKMQSRKKNKRDPAETNIEEIFDYLGSPEAAIRLRKDIYEEHSRYTKIEFERLKKVLNNDVTIDELKDVIKNYVKSREYSEKLRDSIERNAKKKR